MQTKFKDTPYCGVREDIVLKAQPTLDWDSVYHFKTFVIDRYQIHKRKDVRQLPAPWTKNSILQEYKFTNVRREHDRQSRYLIDNITHNPHLTLEDKIINSMMFRAWNNWATLKDFGFPYTAEELYNSDFKERIRPIYQRLKKAEPNRLWYSNAYNHGGTKCAWAFADGDSNRVPFKFGNERELGWDKFDSWESEVPLRPLHVAVWAGRINLVERLLNAEDQMEAFKIINSIRGCGGFIAYQMFVDLTYIDDFPFSENEFTIAGPGCRKGLDYIFKDRDGMTYEECIFWLRDHINQKENCLFQSPELFTFEEEHGYSHKNYDPYKLFNDLPEYDRCMNVMSLENCMCELSKYIRAVRGEGRPRNKYHYATIK